MLALAVVWQAFSVYLALPWMRDLARLTDWPAALLVVAGIALIPGSVNAFLVAGLALDRRPQFRAKGPSPPVTILIAAYNERDYIGETLDSIARQTYAAAVEILVIDDGSTDQMCDIVHDRITSGQRLPNQSLRLIAMPVNGGKARALNAGLAQAAHEMVITVDADSLLYAHALERLVINQQCSPIGTAATAGTVLVRNSRKNLLTKMQEWDYFLGIAVVKRVQSLLQGTLAAQGAFSIYRRAALLEVGGWQEVVGEDIVLTWALLERGYRIGYAENAFVFTNVPETYGDYYRQRKRWSRGLIEAFKRHPGIVFHWHLNTPFIFLNLIFPYLDAIYLLVFVPGVIAALFFHFYAIVGLTTLLVLPLSVACNFAMYRRQFVIFRNYGLKVRRNHVGAILFTLIYQLLLTPASVMGYLSEIASLRKSW